MCVVVPHHLFTRCMLRHLLGKGDAALSRCIPLALPKINFRPLSRLSKSKSFFHVAAAISLLDRFDKLLQLVALSEPIAFTTHSRC